LAKVGQKWVSRVPVQDRRLHLPRLLQVVLPYRPKTAIVLKQVRHALGNGIHFDWHVFDEGYGNPRQ
jgi:hypothetical protein